MNPKIKLLLICALLIIVLLVAELTGIRTGLSPQHVKDLFLQFQLWGILVFCLAFSLGNLLYIPGWIFLMGAVFALGKEWGGLTTYIAALSSSVFSFFIIDKIGGGILRNLNNKYADRILLKLDQYPTYSIALLRVLFQTMPALNYALALAKVRFSHYIIGTIIGLPLPIFIYCYFFEIIFKQVLQ